MRGDVFCGRHATMRVERDLGREGKWVYHVHGKTMIVWTVQTMTS